MKMTPLERILLLLTCLLAAYQIVVGVEGLSELAVFSYTLGFGVLLLASLLMIILGFEVLASPPVVIIATLLPLSLALGLVWEHLPAWRIPYLIFTIAGFLAVLVTRLAESGRLGTIALVVVHGVAGLVIFILPIALSLSGQMPPGYILVGVGGALIGAGGLLLSFLKMGKPILPQSTLYRLFPGLLLAATAAFVAGFALG
jgi:glucan phosphoethanolaminetransferase (alkaline phosphatase superfamily)